MSSYQITAPDELVVDAGHILLQHPEKLIFSSPDGVLWKTCRYTSSTEGKVYTRLWQGRQPGQGTTDADNASLSTD